MQEIELVPIGAVDRATLAALREPLAQRFGAEVAIGRAIELRPEWYDPEPGQYRADAILDALEELHQDGRRLLGVTDADLYAPGYSFVFGQATVGGCCGVIGLARLRPEFYGDPPDERRFLERALIEAVHELGHMAGLDHCPDPHCVMHFSRTLEDTDIKGPDFCPRCRP